MAEYICKCGKTFAKNTSAAVTGYRDTADCTGCPYLLEYGPQKWDGSGFRLDVQALTFGDEIMNAAAADTEYTLDRMDKILAGSEEPQSCGVCPWCLCHKKITAFTEI